MTLVSPRRAGRPAAASSVAPVASGYERSLRPCSEPPIAPRRRSLIPNRTLSLEPVLGEQERVEVDVCVADPELPADVHDALRDGYVVAPRLERAPRANHEIRAEHPRLEVAPR